MIRVERSVTLSSSKGGTPLGFDKLSQTVSTQ